MYSEIKAFLSELNASDLAAIKQAYKRCNEMLVYLFENIDKPIDLIKEMLKIASDADELCELIDSIEVFEQIEAEVLDYTESIELTYKAVVSCEIDHSTRNWRIIDSNHIDNILAEEIADDTYMLGCFQAWVIADATGWPISLVEAAQKAELFSEIGEGMTEEQINEVAEIYAQHDGYGHHFATQDGDEHEIYVTESGKSKLRYYLFSI